MGKLKQNGDSRLPRWFLIWLVGGLTIVVGTIGWGWSNWVTKQCRKVETIEQKVDIIYAFIINGKMPERNSSKGDK